MRSPDPSFSIIQVKLVGGSDPAERAELAVAGAGDIGGRRVTGYKTPCAGRRPPTTHLCLAADRVQSVPRLALRGGDCDTQIFAIDDCIPGRGRLQ